MAFSMFQASVPICTQMLGSLSTVVDKAAAHCAEKKYDEAALLRIGCSPTCSRWRGRSARPAISAATSPGRLAGVELPNFAADRRDLVRRSEGARRQVARFREGLHAGADRRDRRTRTSTGRRASGRCRSRAAHICCISACRTSTSTAPRRTTSCATAAWNSASGTSSARSENHSPRHRQHGGAAVSHRQCSGQTSRMSQVPQTATRIDSGSPSRQ